MKRLISSILSAVILFTLSACGSSSSGGSSGSSTSQNHKSSTRSNKHATRDENTITNAAIKATMDVESTTTGTIVDYASHTMTQGGQKVGFELVPASGHQNDFKEE